MSRKATLTYKFNRYKRTGSWCCSFQQAAVPGYRANKMRTESGCCRFQQAAVSGYRANKMRIEPRCCCFLHAAVPGHLANKQLIRLWDSTDILAKETRLLWYFFMWILKRDNILKSGIPEHGTFTQNQHVICISGVHPLLFWNIANKSCIYLSPIFVGYLTII